MKRFLAVGLIGLLAGCAKFPTTPGGIASKRLVFTMTVVGQIRPDYVYIVALRPSTDLSPIGPGPIPVIAPPWGNGFVAGNVTYFVRWDPLLTPHYGIFKFQDALLNTFAQTGVPVTYTDVPTGGRQIQFAIDLSQIADSVDAANLYQSIQVNFLTMDRVPRGISGGGKNYDALGDTRTPAGINQYITIPLRSTGIYDNNRFFGIEPTGDVVSSNDPDLDISDFSVEIRSN